MEQWWRAIDRGRPKYSKRNLSQCHFVHHKSHKDWLGIETGSARLEAGIVMVVVISILSIYTPDWPLFAVTTEVEISTRACIRVIYGARVVAIYVRIKFIVFVINDAHISDE